MRLGVEPDGGGCVWAMALLLLAGAEVARDLLRREAAPREARAERHELGLDARARRSALQLAPLDRDLRVERAVHAGVEQRRLLPQLVERKGRKRLAVCEGVAHEAAGDVVRVPERRPLRGQIV